MKARTGVLFVTLLIAWVLKRHYADARADELLWILAPTAQLVGAATGVTFTWLPGEGYLSREQLFLIEKSCAGVNFMIAAFVLLVVAWLRHAGAAGTALRVVGVSLIAGYGAAVLINTVRIAIAMWLASHPPMVSVFTAEEVHRVEGVVVYFGGLVGLYELARRVDGRVPIRLRS